MDQPPLSSHFANLNTPEWKRWLEDFNLRDLAERVAPQIGGHEISFNLSQHPIHTGTLPATE